MIRLLVILVCGVPLFLRAQVPLPVITSEDRFFIFHDGRFEQMEPRPPKKALAMNGQFVYQDQQGQLKIFLPEGRRLHLLDRRSDIVLKGTRKRVAWMAMDTLKTVREGRAVILAENVQRFTVGDSIIVLLDSARHEMIALWKRTATTLATVQPGSESAQWAQGSNTVVFFNKEAGSLFAYYHGSVKLLCDSTDVGIVATGGDIVGYWHGGKRNFRAYYKGADVELADLRPARVLAGEGLLAFVDANGRLKCFEQGVLHTVLDEAPTDFWVKDSLLLFLHDGRLNLFQHGSATVVEPYVPEQWQVEGGLLAYLDINRELRGIVNGERFRFGKEANINGFELYGDAVIYRSPLGPMVVATKRRIDEY